MIQALRTTLSSESGCWLLLQTQQAAVEEAWCSRQDNQLAQHVIDRTFVAEGYRWIVDYKTVWSEAADLDLRQQAKRHRAQLARYAALFAGDVLPLRCAVYFPVQGKLEVLG